MRLHTLTVRHYRRHKELRVELDPARTLIGGPNESGKSTLVEAVHRALFLRAKGNSKDHKGMLSLTHDGKPEVELEFEVGGQRYTLIKAFKGANGTARLTQAGGSTWQGDEAEERLTQLLKPSAHSNKLPDQWSHLWVWQGGSAEDPLKQAQGERDTLVQRLQAQGGAAVIQSALDTQVVTHFATQVEETFKANGEARSTSDYGRALKAEEEALAAETQARTALQNLQQAITDHEQASLQLSEAEAALKNLEKERALLDQRTTQITALRQQEQEQTRLVKEAALVHDARVRTEQKVTELRANLQSQRAELAPRQEKLAALQAALSTARSAVDQAESDHQAAEDTLRRARADYDLAQAQATLAEKTRTHALLQQRVEKIETLTAQRDEIEKKAKALPQVDTPLMRQLQEFERAQHAAEAVLKSVATEIEVIASDAPIQIGNETLVVGQSRTLTTETELISGSTRLRIRPGGGTSLSDAKQKAQEARSQLESALSKLAVKDISEASAAHTEREQLQAEWKNLTAELKGLGADKISSELTAAGHDLTAMQAEVTRRGGDTPVELKSAKASLEDAERQQQSLRSRRDQSLALLKKADAEFSSLTDSMRKMEQNLQTLETQLSFLLEREGDDASRAQALAATLSQKTAAETQLQTLRQAIAKQEPDQLNADRTRSDRIWEAQSAKKTSANEKRISANALLRSDGSSDPAAALALAQARTQQAQAHRQALELQAKAMRRVHELLQQEQHTLADQFTQPLADRVTGYLQRLFGQDVRVQVTLQDNEFQSLTLSRDGQGAFPFDSLSQGAREQLAAAFRLALAEILAESHDGTLPIVFDDAFAHSDPARVQNLQRMLDLAATRGLQIILLTCTPGDYAMLGAKEVRLG